MFDKVDELETIMLGEDKDDPKFAWLKKKFDALREDYPAQQYVQADGLCPNCGKDFFVEETIVDGELRCSCARR